MTLRIALYGWLAVIVFGSLVPFQFDPTLGMDRMRGLGWPMQRADILANILLFVPYGFTVVLLARRKRGLIGLCLLGIVTAVAVQYGQIPIPERTPDLGDAMWNTVGLAVGVFGAWLAGKNVRRELRQEVPPAGLAVIFFYFFFQLVPFHVQLSRTGLLSTLWHLQNKALLDPATTIANVLCTVLLYVVLVTQTSRGRARVLTVIAVLLVAFAKPLLADRGLGAAAMLGILIALPWLLMRPGPRTIAASAVVALLMLGLDGVAQQPWRALSAVPGWVPFAEIAGAHWLQATTALMRIGFLQASAYVLLRALSSPGGRSAAPLVVGTTLAAEFTRLVAGEGYATVSAPLLALVVCASLAGALRRQRRRRGGSHSPLSASEAASARSSAARSGLS